MAVNPAHCLILIADCPPWFNCSDLLLVQFVICLSVSSWLSPQSNEFVFIEHLLCLEGRQFCPGVCSKCWHSSLQGLEGSWHCCLQVWTSQENHRSVPGGFLVGKRLVPHWPGQHPHPRLCMCLHCHLGTSPTSIFIPPGGQGQKIKVQLEILSNINPEVRLSV